MLKLILGNFISRMLTAVLNFGTIILISRKLGPEGKGLSALILLTLVSVQMICDFAGGAALVYWSPRYRLRSLLLPIWTWTFLCSIGLFIWLQFETTHLLYGTALQATALCFINASFSHHIHLLNGRQQFKTTALILLVQSAVTLGCTLLFLLDRPEVFDYFYALLISWSISWLSSLFFLWKTRDTALPSFDIKSHAKKLFGNGLQNQMGHVLQFLNQRVFYLFIPAYTLGIFSNAVALGESIWMIAGSIATIQYGKIANMSNHHEAALLSARLFRTSIWLSLFAVIVVACIPGGFYELIFGFAFVNVKSSLLGLLPGVVFLAGYLILGHYFSGTGRFFRNNISIFAGVLATFTGFALYHVIAGIKPDEIVASRITSVANASICIAAMWQFKSDSGLSWRELFPTFSDLYNLRHWLRNSSL
ncbi:MAG: lipopolysaccharide biosynthesis protein [Bacteroidia bacterium]